MAWWNRQEMRVIALMVSLMLLGMAVKYYRAAHPAAAQTAQQN